MAEISVETWRKILQNVRERLGLSDITFRAWLQPLMIREVRDNTIVVLVTTGIMGTDYIIRKFLHSLKAAAREITGIECEISLILSGKENEQ